jgi:cold-inducible RNA-binding protein
MNRKLYVGNLPYGTTELELQTLFTTAGSVASVQLIRERETGRARGFAFVEMATDADAQNAITNLNDAEFGGRNLLVNEARPQPAGGGFGRTRGNRRW